MTGYRMTVNDLLKSIKFAVDKEKDISCANILWLEVVEEGSDFEKEYNITPGAVLMGVEFLKEGKLIRGTLRFEPQAINTLIN